MEAVWISRAKHQKTKGLGLDATAQGKQRNRAGVLPPISKPAHTWLLRRAAAQRLLHLINPVEFVAT
jgi:hypothetical protein